MIKYTTLISGTENDIVQHSGQYVVKYFVDSDWKLAHYNALTGYWMDSETGVRKPDPLKWISLRGQSFEGWPA